MQPQLETAFLLCITFVFIQCCQVYVRAVYLLRNGANLKLTDS